MRLKHKCIFYLGNNVYIAKSIELMDVQNIALLANICLVIAICLMERLTFKTMKW